MDIRRDSLTGGKQPTPTAPSILSPAGTAGAGRRSAANNYDVDLLGNVSAQRSEILPRELPFVAYPTTKRRRNARPTHKSRIPRGTNIATALYGAQLQGLPLLPQGEEISAVLNARRPDGSVLYDQVVVLVPRRAAKTTSIWSEILGRCASIPGYRVYVTAQDGQRSREILRDDIMENLRGQRFEERGLGTFMIGNGSESVHFSNRSLIRAVPPKPSIFRSKHADVIYLDEAGEYETELGADLVAAALPLMDTRHNSQIIISGTPSLAREGLLWDKLQAGIDASPANRHVGVLAYMIRDDESIVLEQPDGTLELNTKVLQRVHPGIGTLTTLAKIATRYGDIKPLSKFEMEYACRFPLSVGSTAIDPADWEACSGGAFPVRPQRVGLGFDVEPDDSCAALVAAWRDAAGRPHLEVLAAQPGSDWLPGKARQAVVKHRATPAFDQIGANLDPAEALNRMRVATSPLALRWMQAATSRLAREIASRQLIHHDQPDLSDAAEGAVWRTVGEGGKLFGRKASAAPVCTLVAGAAALWSYDQAAPRDGVARSRVRTGDDQ